MWYTKHPKDFIWQSRSDKHFQQRNSIKNQDRDEKAQLQSLKYFKKKKKKVKIPHRKEDCLSKIGAGLVYKKKEKRASWRYEPKPFSIYQKPFY